MNNDDIYNECESFLTDWNRGDWMVEHGTWASEEWEDRRAVYDHVKQKLEDALDNLKSAFDALPDGDAVRGDGQLDLAEIAEVIVKASTMNEAADALDSQVLPDESDYIAEGLIDPDDASEAEKTKLGVGDGGQGWDCREGWDAYRVGDDLYLNWWRVAYGERHDRDLWVQVTEGYFDGEES